MADLARFKDELRKEMNDFKAKLERDLRKEMRELKSSMDFFNEKFEQAKQERSELEQENKSLKETNEKLLLDCETLRKQVFQHEQRITASDQYSRKCNLEVKGLPYAEGENLVNTVSHIGRLVNEPISESDIDACHRVPTKNQNVAPNIVLQFKCRSKRDAVLERARKIEFSTRDFGHESSEPVLINEHLCPAMKQLLAMTVAQKKAKNWRFVWTRGGKVYARKDENSSVVHIRSAHDVEKIV